MRRVAELGDGWVAVPKSFAVFQETYTNLKTAADKAGRDLKSIQVMIGPSMVSSVQSFVEELKKYRDLGYDSFLASVAFWGADLKRVLGVMEDFAQKVGM